MIEVRNGAIIVTNKYDPKRKRSMTKKKAEKILKHGKVGLQLMVDLLEDIIKLELKQKMVFLIYLKE